MGRIFVTDRAGEEHEIDIEPGTNVMDPLRELDSGVEALCGGMCSCATCHVFIEPEWFQQLDPREDDELELLEETESFREGESRLSCQLEFSDDLEGMRLTIAPEE
jgi:2Fe-2S ferredoxin